MAIKIIVILSILFSLSVCAQVNPCTTPDGEKTTCISLFSCPGLMKALGTLERPLIQHVHKSICPIGGSGEFYVCCGEKDRIVSPSPAPTPESSPRPSKPAKEKPTPSPSKAPPVNPEKAARRETVKKYFNTARVFCGRQHNDARFSTSNETALDEFPWMVRIKISDSEYDEEYGDRCSGVIISDRYVLTDAYCAYHAIKVVVGEYKTNTSISCGNDPDLPECTDPAYEVRVDELIREGKQENGPYNLALLRLNRTIQFTDYVRPICLPFKEDERAQKKDTLTFSGWGSLGPGVVTKKRLLYDQTTDKECYEADTVSIEGNVKFANVTHLCVRSKKTNVQPECNGDHGGPLMFSRKARWIVEAIVINVLPEDYGCHTGGLVSSIKITSKTLDWIIDTIIP